MHLINFNYKSTKLGLYLCVHINHGSSAQSSEDQDPFFHEMEYSFTLSNVPLVLGVRLKGPYNDPYPASDLGDTALFVSQPQV